MKTEEHNHYKLYKPVGYLSQFVNNQTKRKNKRLLGELHPFVSNVMAVGRLDENSEGLLFITTNGKLSYKILNKGIEKEYYVQLDGEIDHDSISKLSKGIEISINSKAYITKPCTVKLIEIPTLPPYSKPIKPSGHNKTSWISITLIEGKYRQVRKMTAAVGFPTLRLIRYRIGNETIKNLNIGEVINIIRFDI